MNCIYRHSYSGPLYPVEMSYIGKAKDPYKRWGNNGSGYKGQYFGEIINRIGWNNMTHEILESNIPDDEIHEKERFYIAKYNSQYSNGHGWNVA